MSLPGRSDPDATLVSRTPRHLGVVAGAPEDAVETLRDAPAAALPDLPVDPTRFPITERDTYIIAGKFAQGGIGRILRAHDPRLDRPVALKELLVRGHPIDEERFIREVLLTARLQHPGIVPVYAAGRWPSGEPFYAMKLVSGRSFDAVIAEARTLPARLALLPHVLAIAETVAYAHSQGIIHRDLKPHNVLVGAFGETVVIDWGLAKELAVPDPVPQEQPLAPRTVPPAQGLTFVGAVVGTPGYMSPEQADGTDVDARTDVYALGAILYHVLSGRLPYDASNQMNLVYRTVYEDPIPLRAREPDAPDELVAIVDKAMARGPAGRYPDAKAFADDLRRYQTGQIVGAHRYSPWEHLRRFIRRNRALLGLAAVSLALIVAVVVYSFLEIRRERDEAEAAERAAAKAERRTLVALDEAQDRGDHLALQQARMVTDTDPDTALRLLRDVSPRADWRRVRLLAADLQQRGLPTVLHGHRAAVSRAAFSPDSRLLATTSDDCTARIWDLSERTSFALYGHTNQVWRAAWSPDQRLLATSSRDGSVRVWDVAARQAIAVLTHEREVRNVAFAPDGRTIYTGGDDETLRRWDLDSGASEELARCHVNNVLWTTTLVGCVNQEAGEVLAFDTRSGARTLVRAPSELRLAYTAGVSPDGRYVTAGTVDGRVWLWDQARGEGRILTWEGKASLIDAPPREPRFSPASDRLVLPASTQYLQLYDLTRDRGELYTPHEGGTRRATFSPDGRTIASVGFDAKVTVLDLETRTMRHLAAGALMIDPQFSPDGRWLAAVGNDPRVWLWQANSLQLEQFVPAPPRRPIFTHSAARDAFLVHREDHAEVIDLETFRPRHRLALPRPQLVIALSGDARSVVGFEEPGLITLWDARTGRELIRSDLGAGCSPPGFIFEPGGPRMIVQCRDGAFYLLDPRADNRPRELLRDASGSPVLFLPGRPEIVIGASTGEVLVVEDPARPPRLLTRFLQRVYSLALVPGSDRIFAASDAITEQWSISGALISRLPDHQLQVSQLAVSDDGRWIATASRDNKLRIFDVASGALAVTISPSSMIARLLAFSPDGAQLAVIVTSGDVELWDLRGDDGRLVPRPEVRTLRANGDIGTLFFAADGRTLITHDGDGRVIRWRDTLPDDPAELRAWIDERLGRDEPVEASTSCALPPP